MSQEQFAEELPQEIKEENLSEPELEDNSYEEDPDAVEILEYEQSIMVDTLADDVLFIGANGMGLERLFLNHLIMYSDRKTLVLVLNTSDKDEAYFLAKLKNCAAVECPPKLINSDVSVSDRLALYMQGGIQFITSRILMVDFLTERIPAKHIAGILVYRAHQVLNSFQESFILRLYREKKKGGFVKAFTDFPTTISGLGQLQRLIDRLYVKKVRLIPRFDSEVKRTLEKKPPACVEMSVDLPGGVRKVHAILLDLLKVCMRELKQASISTKLEEEDDSFNACAYGVTELERRLNARRSFLSDRQQRLLSDVEILRSLLRMSEDMDMCTLMVRMNQLKTDKESVENSSGWMQTPTATRMFEQVRALANLGDNSPEFVAPSKWTALENVLEEIKGLYVPPEEMSSEGPCVLMFVNDEHVMRQLADLVRKGPARLKGDLKHTLRKVSTNPPLAPLWNPEDVTWFTRSDVGGNQATRKEVMTDVQKNQKETVRVAKKRRKVAEQLTGFVNTAASTSKQTTIMQFGVMEYKKKRRKEPEEDDSQSVNSSSQVKEEEEDVDESLIKSRLDQYEKFPLILMPHGERYSTLRALDTYQPVAIIMYNMDILTLRQIEIWYASNSSRQLHFYLLQYRESTEEERYLSKLNKEQKAFHMLMQESSNLMIPVEYETFREEALRLKISSRIAGGQQEEPSSPPKIIVDMREFNSELPTILYKKGYDVAAATLEVGDYVLTPGTCVERKALDDLTQSLQSGRVFKQTEQMFRHYPGVILLIESNQKFEQKIVNGGPFQGELTRHCRDIRAQLCCLIRTHPKLKLIWSLSPTNSAEYYAELKIGADEPDLDTAMSFKGDDAESAASSVATKSSKVARPNAVILRHLTEHLPGMNRLDVQRVMLGDTVTNLRDLLTASQTKLESAVGDEHVDRLNMLFEFDFLASKD